MDNDRPRDLLDMLQEAGLRAWSNSQPEKTVKIVINTNYGGFGLSDKGEIEWLKQSEFVTDNLYWHSRDIPRTDPSLVGMVEYALKVREPYDGDPWGVRDLRVVEIPDDVEWYISEYDGLEHIAEGRTWYASL